MDVNQSSANRRRACCLEGTTTSKKYSAKHLKRKGSEMQSDSSVKLLSRSSTKGRRSGRGNKVPPNSRSNNQTEAEPTPWSAYSIPSGELGDSDESGPSSSRGSTRWGSRKIARKITRRLETFHDSPPQKRKIKRRMRPEPMDQGEEDEVKFLIDHHFEVPVQRGPFESSAADISSVSEEDKTSNPSETEDFDTEPEMKVKSPDPTSLDTSGVKGYLNACGKLKVAPCSRFLRSCKCDTLSLKHYGLGPKEMKALSRGLHDNTFISTIDLGYNRMGAEGVFSFAHALKTNQHISHISLAYCFLGKSSKGGMAVLSILKNSKFTHYLDVSHNYFSNQDYQWFTEILQMPTRLCKLDISDNEFSTGLEFKKFLRALQESDTLKDLNMEWNPLTPVGVREVLTAVAKNMSLKHLNLTHTGIDNTTVPQLQTLIKINDYLQTLNLTNHRLTKPKITLLSSTLVKFNSQLVISLSASLSLSGD